MIYLDYMATTPVDAAVQAAMAPFMADAFANPASIHAAGKRASTAVQQARADIAAALGTDASEVIFTSGATEANNLAIKGAAKAYARKGKHVITLATEHKAVLEVVKDLEKDGFEVTILPVAKNGLLDLQKLENTLRQDTVLVSCMWVNNEIGVIQDIPAIAKLAHARGALLHVDAAQAVGPLKIDMQQAGVDLLSISAHKIYGPKGVGALLLRKQPRLHLQTQIHGGGDKRRAGTLPTALIVGLAKAVTFMDEIRTQEQQRQLQLREYLYSKLKDNPNIIFNGDLKSRIAGNLNFSVKNIQGEKVQQAMQDAGIMLSSGSACNADLPVPSHVLLALGVKQDLALASLRVSLGRGSKIEDADKFVQVLIDSI